MKTDRILERRIVKKEVTTIAKGEVWAPDDFIKLYSQIEKNFKDVPNTSNEYRRSTKKIKITIEHF